MLVQPSLSDLDVAWRYCASLGSSHWQHVHGVILVSGVRAGGMQHGEAQLRVG